MRKTGAASPKESESVKPSPSKFEDENEKEDERAPADLGATGNEGDAGGNAT